MGSAAGVHRPVNDASPSRLPRPNAAFDVVVVGGGITGAGIARDAAMRGLKTALFERQDFASGTSSRSSKLVHGGLRYLEHGELGLVFEAVSERRTLLDIAPHLVRPVPFLFPTYAGSRRHRLAISAGMWLYDGLSLFRSPKMHRSLRPAEVRSEEPALCTQDLTGASVYYDCATDDARLTLENVLAAHQSGAFVANWCEVTGVRRADGMTQAVEVRDALTGACQTVSTSCVVVAAGPWTPDVVSCLGGDASRLRLRPTKGVHIVVDQAKLPVHHAVVALHPEDGRVLFAIPWGERTYIGTTDTDFHGSPDDVVADRDDVMYLIAAMAQYFPEHRLTPEDVVATWAGLRPLIATGDRDDGTAAISREHEVHIGADGTITVAGGKLTTYRRMAAEVVDAVDQTLRLRGLRDAPAAPCRTAEVPLPGALGWPEDDDHDRVARDVRARSGGALSLTRSRYLADTYGLRALDVAARVADDPRLAAPLVTGRPEVMACVDVAVEEEWAQRLEDVLCRRTALAIRDADQGLGAMQGIARRMANLLHWDAERIDEECHRMKRVIEGSRRWRPAR